MENNKVKKVSIKNCTYYFDDKIKFEDFDSDNVLLDQKQDENILVHKTLNGAKPLQNLCILGSIDGFIGVFDVSSYLVLFGPEKYDVIDKMIRYPIEAR